VNNERRKVFKLVITSTLGEFTIEYLIKQKIIPAVITPQRECLRIPQVKLNNKKKTTIT